MIDFASEFFGESRSGEREGGDGEKTCHFLSEAFDVLGDTSLCPWRALSDDDEDDKEGDCFVSDASGIFSKPLSGEDDAEDCKGDGLNPSNVPVYPFRALSGEEESGDNEGDRTFSWETLEIRGETTEFFSETFPGEEKGEITVFSLAICGCGGGGGGGACKSEDTEDLNSALLGLEHTGGE
ncbi:hypothetical protein L484_013776 [Morus notabilis]|uniref:Uncharacterized protein n=1 Tax=Morus notabilis TaxID=981085 RepID=W9QWM4_9ROSA|nr:hypothetical protein L484_013776 [Morus notabilis]